MREFKLKWKLMVVALIGCFVLMKYMAFGQLHIWGGH